MRSSPPPALSSSLWRPRFEIADNASVTSVELVSYIRLLLATKKLTRTRPGCPTAWKRTTMSAATKHRLTSRKKKKAAVRGTRQRRAPWIHKFTSTINSLNVRGVLSTDDLRLTRCALYKCGNAQQRLILSLDQIIPSHWCGQRPTSQFG